MTITYALTRQEILRSFLLSMRNSPGFLRKIVLNAVGAGLFFSLVRALVSRAVTFEELLYGLGWMIGTLIFFPFWITLTAKTDTRTLTIGTDGITTRIGSRTGQVPWRKVNLVINWTDYILISSTLGNAFFVPDRAFSAPEQRAQFIAGIESGRKALSSSAVVT